MSTLPTTINHIPGASQPSMLSEWIITCTPYKYSTHVLAIDHKTTLGMCIKRRRLYTPKMMVDNNFPYSHGHHLPEQLSHYKQPFAYTWFGGCVNASPWSWSWYPAISHNYHVAGKLLAPWLPPNNWPIWKFPEKVVPPNNPKNKPF